MSELSDKVKGWTMSIIGAGGVMCGIIAITDDSKKIGGYAATIASLACLNYGIEYIKKVYFNRET